MVIRTFNLDSRMTSTRKQLDKSAEDFPALPGFYKLLFLYLEPSVCVSNLALCNH